MRTRRKEPTARELDVLRFVADSLLTDRLPPTLLEVSHAMGWVWHTSARAALESLHRKGLISVSRTKTHRSRTLTASGWRAIGYEPCPTCGQVRAA